MTAPGTSLLRAFSVLDLFGLGTPLLSPADVSARLGYTRSTAYRYLRELTGAGLVAQAAPGVYSLGPRIVELERLMALTDPLYSAGHAVLRDQPCDNSALLLHNLYEDKVLCIYHAGPEFLEFEGRRLTIRRARGLPFPLFQGAASLALLASLSPHRMRQTWLRFAAQIAAAGLGDRWDDFRRQLAVIRREGYATSQGTITPQVGGIAVPILAPGNRRLLGSLARTFPVSAMPFGDEQRCVEDLRRLAARIATGCAEASARRRLRPTPAARRPAAPAAG